GLDGTEEYSIRGLSGGLEPRQEVTITAKKADGSTVEFKAISRLDTAVEVEYYRNGGILHTVLRKRLEESKYTRRPRRKRQENASGWNRPRSGRLRPRAVAFFVSRCRSRYCAAQGRIHWE